MTTNNKTKVIIDDLIPIESVRPRVRKRVSITFTEPSKTKQEFAAESDISNIMAQWESTGLLEHTNAVKGDYGDYIHVQDYHSSLTQLIAAQDMFDSLPAKLRFKFDNDPATFLEFAQDPKNADQLVSLGLAIPKSKQSEPDVPNPSESDNKGGSQSSQNA